MPPKSCSTHRVVHWYRDCFSTSSWWLLEGCTTNRWKMFVGYLWKLFERCLRVVWELFESCLGVTLRDIWQLLESHLRVIWKLFGGCLFHDLFEEFQQHVLNTAWGPHYSTVILLLVASRYLGNLKSSTGIVWFLICNNFLGPHVIPVAYFKFSIWSESRSSAQGHGRKVSRCGQGGALEERTFQTFWANVLFCALVKPNRSPTCRANNWLATWKLFSHGVGCASGGQECWTPCLQAALGSRPFLAGWGGLEVSTGGPAKVGA